MAYSSDPIRTEDLEVARRVFENAYRHARERAAKIIDGDGLTDEQREEALMNACGCGTCAVNQVIEQIEPSILAYIRTLEEALAERNA